MKIENTKAQMRKGVLEYCILSILKDDDAYVAEECLSCSVVGGNEETSSVLCSITHKLLTQYLIK